MPITRTPVPPLAAGSFRKLPYCMRSVGLKILKNKLSEYVRLAAGGEVVLVTRHGKGGAPCCRTHDSPKPFGRAG